MLDRSVEGIECSVGCVRGGDEVDLYGHVILRHSVPEEKVSKMPNEDLEFAVYVSGIHGIYIECRGRYLVWSIPTCFKREKGFDIEAHGQK